MLTFENLVFQARPDWFGGRRATLTFANGYSISVIDGPNAYCGRGSYEVAVMHDGTCDVLKYQSAEEITSIMARIAALPTRRQKEG